MIVTANKYVNARIGNPSTSAVNPFFLKPGDQINVETCAFGEEIEGCNEWFIAEDKSYYTKKGFIEPGDLYTLPFANAPKLFNKLELFRLWNISKGEGIRVGVIDNGVGKHDSLGLRVTSLNNANSVVSKVNHGTTMACIIAANNYPESKVGVSPNVSQIFSYHLNLEKDKCNINAGQLIAALDAMEKANVQVINMSFTCQDTSFFLTQESGRQIQKKIDAMAAKDIILVCAAGNVHKRKREYFPASYQNVLSVTGYNTSRNGLNLSSNYWNGVNIAMDVSPYFEDEQAANSNGTSGAAAIMSGCIACIYNKIPGPKLKTLEKCFRKMPLFKDEDITIPGFDLNILLNDLNT